MISEYYYSNKKLGVLKISSCDGKVSAIEFVTEGNQLPIETTEKPECVLRLSTELDSFLSNSPTNFSNYSQDGTDFQKKVWHAISKIPRGSTLTYKELAEKVGNPQAVRAVGTACGKNKLAIVVPCHRVLPSTGGVSGYRWGAENKLKLLNLEKELTSV